MAKVDIEGTIYEVPDEGSIEEQYSIADQMAKAYKGGGAEEAPLSNPMPSNQPVESKAGNIDPDTLQKDAKWVESAKVLYKKHHGVDFDGTPEEAANYGLNQLAYFNYNTINMAVNAASFDKYTKQEEKEAFLYLMDTYDKTGYSWAGSMRFLTAAAADPLTYVGLGTLGIGTATTAVGSAVGKAAIRSAILASIEGGIQTGIQSSIKQEAKINAGGQTEFDYGELAKESAVGAGFGGVLGGALGAATAKFFPETKSGLARSTLEEKPAGGRKGPSGSGGAVEEGELSVGLGTKLEKGSKQLKEGEALDPALPKLPEGITEAEREALLRLHEAGQYHGEKIDLERELAVLRQINKVPEREVQIGDVNFKLDDTKPKDIDFEGMKVSEDEKAVLEAIKAQADEEAAGKPIEDNRPSVAPKEKERFPTFERSHWEKDWSSLDNDSGSVNAPDWFDNVKNTITELARALGAEAPEVYHGSPRNSGLGGQAYGHGHIIISRLKNADTALATGLHELGHHIEYTLFHNADAETKAAIKAEWMQHRAFYGKHKTVEEHRPLTASGYTPAQKARVVDTKTDTYTVSFPEWFAEQVQRALTTKTAPISVVEKFFANIAEKWKAIYAKVTGKLPQSQEVAKFIEQNWHGDLLDQASKGKVDFERELAGLRTGAKEQGDLLKDVDLRIPDPVERIMRAIHDISPDSVPPFEPHARAKLETESIVPAHILINMNKSQVVDYVKQLVNKAVTPEQSLRLSAAFRIGTNQLEAKAFDLWTAYKLITDPAKQAQALKELAQVEKLRDNIKTGDTYLSSMEGSALAQRPGSINTGKFRGVSEESILTEWLGDPKLATDVERNAAKQEYYRLVSAYYDRAEAAAKVRELKTKLDAAVTEYFSGSGKFEDLMAIYKQMKDEQLKAADNDSKEFNLFKDSAKKIINDVNQVIISTVFSPATLMVNTIPSLVKTLAFPALNAVIKGPTDEAAVKEMLTFYHTMYNNIGISWQMAKAAWQLERSLMMTEDYGNRFLEGAKGTGVLDNRLGRALRFFPRVLTATDEFFQSLNYRGYVMGEAHYAALRDANKAVAEGRMAAADKEAYITSRLQQASDNMFANVQDKAHLLEWTTEVGKERGLKGAELDDWVKKQLSERGHLMKEVSSESGARYVEDLLFKRKFSGEGALSEAAAKYENYANNNPWMRTVGQLFFRTPVRVFEEGIRMTPGFNLFAPNYLNDLRGVNGMPAQVKATREAMLGFAITHWIMAQYAAGNITGGGPMDYKQRRDIETSDWQAYTIKTPVGDLNYRNLDPFVTPIKIVVNMMDRLSHLEHEKATGKIKDNSTQETMALLGVAVGSVMQSVKDANLWDGLNQIWSAGEKSVDPEHSGFDKFMVHFLGQKAAYVVPSVVSKVKQIGQPQLTNPATIAQYVEAKWNPNSTSVAHIHDVLGNVRTQADPLGKLVGLQLSDENMRKAGRSDKQIEVLREIAKLSVAGNTNFAMPTKDAMLAPGIDDLRSTMTNDGSSTLYDRVNSFMRDSDLTDQLHNVLVGKEHLPVATRVSGAKQIISAYRKKAFIKLWSEKSGMREDFIADKLFQAEGKAGYRDSNSLPYISND